MTPEKILEKASLENTEENRSLAEKIIKQEQELINKRKLRQAFDDTLEEENSEKKNMIEKIAKDIGMVPIDIPSKYATAEFNQMSAIPEEDKSIVMLMDINVFPSEYNSLSLEELIKKYYEDFNVKIIPIDVSKQNMRDRVGIDYPVVQIL